MSFQVSEDAMLVARFTGYLKLVVRHASYDYFRRRERYDRHILRPVEEHDKIVEFDQLFEALRAPQTGFEFEDRLVMETFRQLKKIHQRILVYTFVDRLTEAEIAERVGCGAGYVRKIRHRAVSRMRQLLKRGGAL